MTRATAILSWFSLTLVVSLGLYHTSYRVEHLSRQLKELNAEIAAEQRTLHILKAEWVYLSNPSRLEAAARKHLNLQPTEPGQISKLAKLTRLLPTQAEAMGSTTVAAAPLASLKLQPAMHSPKSSRDEHNRLNTHMVLQKAASAETLERSAPLPTAREASYTLANSGDAP